MYRDLIQDVAQGHQPRHIEAWMRLELGTLDYLSLQQFRDQVKAAIACIIAGGEQQSEDLAKTFGL